MTMAGAVIGSQHRLRRQQQSVTTPIAFGFVHPAGQTRDALFMSQPLELQPIENDFRALGLFHFPHQQQIAPGRVFPGDRPLWVPGAVGAQMMQVVAHGMQAGLCTVAGPFG